MRPLGYEGFRAARWQPLFDDCDINGALTHCEIQHPFLDLRLVQYMLALPAMPWCRNKLIIRRSMRTALPRDVLGAEEDHDSGECGFQAGPRGRIAPAGAIAGSVALREPRQDDVHAEKLSGVARRVAAAWLELLAWESRQYLLRET